MSCGEAIWRRAADDVLAKAIDRVGRGLATELLESDDATDLSDADISRLATAIGVADQIEARYGPSSARLWFDNTNVFLTSGEEIRPIEMLASEEPYRYSKLQCALNIHLGKPPYD